MPNISRAAGTPPRPFDPTLFNRVQRVSPDWIREHLRPTEAPTWREVERYIRDEHFACFPDHWQALRDSIARSGVRRPLITFNGQLTNGHHRWLLAAETHRASVPLIARDRWLLS